MKKLNYSINLLIISLITMIIGFFTKITFFYLVSILSLTASFFSIAITSYFIAFILNALLLLLLPTVLLFFNEFLLNSMNTPLTVFIICWILFMSIINFMCLAFNMKSGRINSNNMTLIRLVCLFLLYIFILYGVLRSFGVLYKYLSNVFNEGLESDTIITSHLDALYFSVTTFFTIGFGDITPSDYSEITKQLVIIQAVLGHLINTVLWPVSIIFIFNKKSLKEVFNSSSNDS
ncbi:ion channel [Natranaerovirga pectinivora]|uniref:Ion channel n=1 Tax=Natranaerovirga pectinivora TaxID=682400 RepID=A0A4R3MQF2_9FIRM|nr:ion channel [Natranaerovirga pectinivora]TCT16753.1 ion channel [Natranaerovirga pectinivora]